MYWGGFYKTLNFDLVFAGGSRNLQEQFSEFFGDIAFSYLNTFHYVLDGIDVHVTSSDSIWLLNNNAAIPSSFYRFGAFIFFNWSVHFQFICKLKI